MLSSLFGTKEDKLLAKHLAEQVERRLPPTVAKTRNKTINIQRLGDILESILNQATDYNRNHKLNFIRKAKVANTFRWELENCGYPTEFCTEITKSLVIYLAKK